MKRKEKIKATPLMISIIVGVILPGTGSSSSSVGVDVDVVVAVVVGE